MRSGVVALALALFFIGCSLPAGADERESQRIVVFAAASLADVLHEIGQAFERETGTPVRLSFAASSALARQIESGAPADAYVSAHLEWMDHLERKALIERETRRHVAGNELVLIASASSHATLDIEPGFALADALGRGRLAIADPASVPAGRYARAALTALGVWSQVESRLVPAQDVRSALAHVSRGEAPLGIVYRTDARVDGGVRIVDVFPAATHPPIVYAAAAVRGGRPAGRTFVSFLAGASARAILSRHGFKAPAGIR